MEIGVAVVCPRSGRPPDHLVPPLKLWSRAGVAWALWTAGTALTTRCPAGTATTSAGAAGDGGTTSGWEIIAQGRTHHMDQPLTPGRMYVY